MVQEGELREPNWWLGKFSVTSARVFLCVLIYLPSTHASSQPKMMSTPSLLAQFSSSCATFLGFLRTHLNFLKYTVLVAALVFTKGVPVG